MGLSPTAPQHLTILHCSWDREGKHCALQRMNVLFPSCPFPTWPGFPQPRASQMGQGFLLCFVFVFF